MWQRFTPSARAALYAANELAIEWKSPFVTSELLFLALIRTSSQSCYKLLAKTGADPTAFRETVKSNLKAGPQDTPVTLNLSHRVKLAIDLAFDEASRKVRNTVNPDDLLLGLLRAEDGRLKTLVLSQVSGGIEALREHLKEAL